MGASTVDRPIFFIADERGRGIAACDGYCGLLGRTRDDIIGVSWETWVAPADVERSRLRQQRVLAGTPECYLRDVERSDGSHVIIAATSMLIPFGRDRLMLTCVNAMFEQQGLTGARAHQAEIALYIEMVAGALAVVVQEAGLPRLHQSLWAVAETAGRMAAAVVPRQPPRAGP